MAGYRIDDGLIDDQNRSSASVHAEDLAHLGRQLERRGLAIERVIERPCGSRPSCTPIR
jgi:hypothetical protein